MGTSEFNRPSLNICVISYYTGALSSLILLAGGVPSHITPADINKVIHFIAPPTINAANNNMVGL